MITITTQGKTYQIVDLKGRIKSTIEEWIRSWFLEEVKENKDSILEKLRNGLEKRKQKMLEENWWPSCIEQVVWTLAVLDSLEQPKEETIHIPPVSEDDKWVNHPSDSWTPTPWQMIEVSNDGEKWGDRPLEFKWMNQHGQYETLDYFEWKNNRMFFSFWNHARPLSQEDIELPWVPDWKAFTNDGRTYDSKDYQIEQLTKFCQAIAPIVNQLIKANKK